MKILIYLSLIYTLCAVGNVARADQSSITEADGQACMGDDKSRKQTEHVALEDAKRLAIEYTSTHLSSSTTVENYQLKEDIVHAFNAATVKVLKILDEKWANPTVSDCFTIKIKAEVIPSKEAMAKVDQKQVMADPRLPLDVKLWVNRTDATYSGGQDMRVYLQGNKPFYARLIYVQADGTNVQLLPNPHRTANYFAGATIFEVPTGEDNFQLTIGPPYGKEKLTLYASTLPLGKLSTKAAAGNAVYMVNDQPREIAEKTRGISINTGPSKQKEVAEFAEASVDVTTKADAPAPAKPAS
ncbi:MAG TPA: DUF4384 domain-containing protein [Pseudomonadales bacterium]|nr:DUF4384 domain-containing protein [Pseudomonadales bacterium]